MEAKRSESASVITLEDLAWWRERILTLDWVFAVTYAQGAPHEYVAARPGGLTRAECERAARVIHTFGEPQKFFKTTRIYLVHDGWKYWTMDREHDEVTLVNRGRAEHVYGVQNMPRTSSDVVTAYDGLASYWDRTHSASNAEREGYLRLVAQATAGRTQGRTLDIGAGTGLTLDLGLAEASRLTAIEPSQPMLNELVRKHPLVARVEPRTLRDALRRRYLGGTRFDLVLALGGAGSYLDEADWRDVLLHASGPLVISVYAEGERPIAGDLATDQLAQARVRLRTLAVEQSGVLERLGRFEVVVVPSSTSRSVVAE